MRFYRLSVDHEQGPLPGTQALKAFVEDRYPAYPACPAVDNDYMTWLEHTGHFDPFFDHTLQRRVVFDRVLGHGSDAPIRRYTAFLDGVAMTGNMRRRGENPQTSTGGYIGTIFFRDIHYVDE